MNNHFTYIRISTETDNVYKDGKNIPNLVRALEYIDSSDKVYDSEINPQSYNNFTEWSVSEFESVTPFNKGNYETGETPRCICKHISLTLHTIKHKDGISTAYIGTKCYKKFSDNADKKLRVASGAVYCACRDIQCSQRVIIKSVVEKYKALGMTVFYKKQCLIKKFKSCYNCKGFKGYDCSCGIISIISNIDKEFKNTALLNHHLVYHYDLVIDQKIKYTQRDFKTGKRKIVCAIVVEINDDNIVVKNQKYKWQLSDKKLFYNNLYVENI